MSDPRRALALLLLSLPGIPGWPAVSAAFEGGPARPPAGGLPARDPEGGCVRLEPWLPEGDAAAIDATAAMVAAAARARETGGAVCPGAGRTYLLRKVGFTATTRIRCEPGAVLKLAAGVDDSMLRWDGGAGSGISGCTLDGDAANQHGDANGAGLVDVVGADDFTFRGNTLRDSYRLGLRVVADRPTIDDNGFSDTGHTSILVTALLGSAIAKPAVTRNRVDRTGRNPDTMLGGGISIQGVNGDIHGPVVAANVVRLPVPEAGGIVQTFDGGASPDYFNKLGIELASYARTDAAGDRISGHWTFGAVVEANTVFGGGESYSFDGLKGGTITGNTARDSVYVGAECVGCVDTTLRGNTYRMHDHTWGYGVWITTSRNVTVSDDVTAGGRGGTGQKWFVASGRVVGGSVTMRSAGGDSAALRSDHDGGLTITGLRGTGPMSYGIRTLDPGDVRVVGATMIGSTRRAYDVRGGGAKAGHYRFVYADDHAEPAAGAVINAGAADFPPGSVATGSAFTRITAPGIAPTANDFVQR